MSKKMKPKTFNSWKDMVEMNGRRKIEFSKTTKREKSLRLVDTQYNLIMNTLREFDNRKEEFLIKGMSDIGRIKVLNFINKCINQMELYRITWLKTQHLDIRDIDGIPHNIVKSKMKQLSEINWNDDERDGNGITGLTIEQIKEDDKLNKVHRTDEIKTIGDYYRTTEHQLLHYEMTYLNLYDDRKML